MDNAQNKSSESFKMIGNWAEQSKELKSKFAQLTDEDLKYDLGKEKELLGRVQSRLNKSHDEVVNIIRKGQPTKRFNILNITNGG